MTNLAMSEAKKRKLENNDAEPVQRSASEPDVGITEFVNKENIGFTGLIKQRFSDFQVNEIDPQGNVVVLGREALEGLDEKKSENSENNEANATEVLKEDDNKNKLTPSSNTYLVDLSKLITEEVVQQCCDLLNDHTSFKRIKTKVINSKEDRTNVHMLVRYGFESQIESGTDNGCITFNKVHKRSRKHKSSKSAGKTAEYLHFTLYKENKESIEAAAMIARFLSIPPKLITFAGTKDRRAATTQRACWRRGESNRLAGLNSSLMSSVRLSSFEYKKYSLRLGDLSGNQFGIVIRNVQESSLAAVDTALESLRRDGFVNYFGLQRFGTFSVSSHHLGQLILAEDFDGAIECLLSPQGVVNDESREARLKWAETHDAQETLKLMPKRNSAECNVLQALSTSPSAINALLRIPHGLKTMYLHAYQSYVWNKAASERVKMDPHNVISGDLVLTEKIDGEVQRARPITEEEIESKKYTVFDIVLPTPGYDVIYPTHLVKFYEELMQKDNIDCHKMRRNIKDFSLFGSYRNIFAKPMFVDWEIRRYVNDDDTILYTDREELQTGIKLAPEPDSSIENAKLAVFIKMGLLTSQYATMALREVMKQETSRHGSLYFA